jgi:hypothetical protein
VTYKRKELYDYKKKKNAKRKNPVKYLWISHMIEEAFGANSMRSKDRGILRGKIASMLSVG